jgi:hypothetical protein
MRGEKCRIQSGAATDIEHAASWREPTEKDVVGAASHQGEQLAVCKRIVLRREAIEREPGRVQDEASRRMANDPVSAGIASSVDGAGAGDGIVKPAAR